jgi:xanthine dehydrogenase/oxidase
MVIPAPPLPCSQALMKTQTTVASALGIPQHKVVVRTKRIGGGFGGKESRTVPIAAAVSIAAFKTHKPVRINIDRDVDMLTTGQVPKPP